MNNRKNESDEEFLTVIKKIEERILRLKKELMGISI